MIFTSESGLLDASRLAAWDEWYLGHLAAMAAVPGVSSAQRFRALNPGPPPSLAMYTVASAAVFDSAVYLRTRGMGEFIPFVDKSLHRRNLFDGLDVAPKLGEGAILLVADRSAPGPAQDGIIWLKAVAIDRSVPYRGIAVFDAIAAAREAAARIEGGATLYTPITRQFEGDAR
jgi:hypothetical protein